MTPEFSYLLKVNIAFALFYAFYRLLFYKDTFFKWRRIILLSFFSFAAIYPLVKLSRWIITNDVVNNLVYAYSSLVPEATETTAAADSLSGEMLLQSAVVCLYFLIVALLLLRFLVRLVSILWLATRSEQLIIQGTRVRVLCSPSGPFSFFSYIFLHTPSHTDAEMAEIITHEQTHASQWHSVDVIVSELFTIACWFNPFVWLLKREVRHNLEYLADQQVIQSGYNSKHYQYHLLGLAHHSTKESGLYNSFSVLHLKNRIMMMNKKRTYQLGKMKYIAILPLFLLLLALNNMTAMARIADEVVPQPETITAVADVIVDQETPKAGDDKVFAVVEVMPTFPGGEPALVKYLKENIKYPEAAQKNKIEGRVICSFVVNKDGSIADARVTRSVEPSLDAEALRVINAFPKWVPGKLRGVAVRTQFTLPVTFRLQK